MGKFFFISVLLILCLGGCTNERDAALHAFINSIDNKFLRNNRVLVFIPANGCRSCIKRAISDIHQAEDTAYVITCKSAKEFHLLTGKDIRNFSNVFLDKGGMSFSAGVLQTVPIIMELENGRIKSQSEYHVANINNSKNFASDIKITPKSINLGQLRIEESIRFLITLENTSMGILHVTKIEPSCECIMSEADSLVISTNEIKELSFIYTPEEQGEFYKYLYLYGNFNGSPIEIEIRGFVK